MIEVRWIEVILSLVSTGAGALFFDLEPQASVVGGIETDAITKRRARAVNKVFIAGFLVGSLTHFPAGRQD